MAGPLLLAALPSLIQAGTGLLSGFMSGAQKEKERKQTFEDWKKQKEYELGEWRTKRSERGSELDKITGRRYRTAQDLGTIDPMLKKLLIGRMSSFVQPGSASSWGIDFNQLLGGIGKTPTAGSPVAPQPAPAAPRLRGKGILDENMLAGNILNKYGQGLMR